MNFDVKISPNPSVSDFKLQILTSVIEKTTVKILGLQGGLIKELILSPYQKNISLGSELNAGTYIVEVRQGKNIKKTKLKKF
jgi:hypothetical protein